MSLDQESGINVNQGVDVNHGANVNHGADVNHVSSVSVSQHDSWLDARAQDRERAGLRRRLRPRASETTGTPGATIDLAGNDYLGLSRRHEVVEAGVAALRAWGAGSTGSRLVTGTTELHAELESELAAFTGFPAALVFASGYASNLGAITALAGPDDLVVSDDRNHASLIDACRLSRAQIAVVPHADVAAFDSALASRTWRRALVVTDSIFSADGDLAPLPALYAVARAHGALLVVDDAHGLGVAGPGGRGALAAAGLAGAPDVVATVTLSKSLGSQGGAILGSEAVRDHLIDTARTFIFDTGLAPACAGSALAALRLIVADPTLPASVRRRADQLAAMTAAPRPAGAVVSVVLGDPRRAVAATQTAARLGVTVGCFRPPSVPAGTSRLRLAARANLTDDEMERIATALSAALVVDVVDVVDAKV